MTRRANTEADFWSKVDKSGGPDACWPWTAYVAPNGYGRFKWRQVQWSAHQFALKLKLGHDPVNLALHTCEDRYPIGDNRHRICCNPAHLYDGTHQHNAADSRRTGRHAVGPRAGLNKLSTEQALDAIERRKCGETTTAIAKSLGVSQALISHICTGRVWKHLDRGAANDNGRASETSAAVEVPETIQLFNTN